MGLLMGWSRTVRDNTDPWIAAAHAIPKVALLPLLIFFLGIGEEPKIALAALVAFFPMLINTMAGVGQIQSDSFSGRAKLRRATCLNCLRASLFPAVCR